MTSRKVKVVGKMPSSADIKLSTMATLTTTNKDKQTERHTDRFSMVCRQRQFNVIVVC